MTAHHSVLILLAAALSALPASAQTGTVSGRVLGPDGATLPGANVVVLAAADSALVRGALADLDGAFRVEAVPAGRYVLRASFVGFGAYTSGAFALAAGEDRDVGDVVLGEGAVSLVGVTVAAERPLFEQRPDRVVVNVGSSPTLQGGTALDVIARAPGVSVDAQSGAISVAGKSGVRVMVNGRVRYVPAEGLAAFLSGLPAGSLRSVEVLTTPPAGLDAEGDAGFINLVLDRPPTDGASGQVSATGGYGDGELGRLALSGQVRRGRLGLFGTYAFLNDGRPQFSTNVRTLADGTVTDATSERSPIQRNHDLRLEADLALSDATTLTATAAAYETRFAMDALTAGSVTGGPAPGSSFSVDVEELNRWRHASGGLGIAHTLGPDHTLRASADLLAYRNENPVGYLDTFTEAGGETTEARGSDKDTPLDVAVVALDYAVPVGGVGLSAGVKGAFSRLENRVDVTGAGGRVPGTDGVSSSALSEDVLAAYAEATLDLGAGTTARLGLRFEHESTELTEGSAPVTDRRTGQLYPSVLVARQAGATQLSASYARRVTRPTFNDQAPFVYFFDPFTLFSGNAALRPAVSNTVRLDASRAGLSASVSLSQEDSTIARFQNVVLDGANAQLITSLNVGRTRTGAATVTVPFARGPWRSQTSATGLVQEVERGAETDRLTTYRVRTTQSVALGPVTAEASAFYNGPFLVGAVRFEAFGGVDLALQSEVRGTRLTLALTDVFDSVERRSLTTEPDGSTVRRLVDFGRRTVQLTLSRRFGGEAPRRTRVPDAAAEERGRAG